MFEGIMLSREEQAKNLARRLVYLALENRMPIVIHGKAYKPRVTYIEGSYSLLVGHFCKELCGSVELSYVDKCTGDTYDSDKPAVFYLPIVQQQLIDTGTIQIVMNYIVRSQRVV